MSPALRKHRPSYGGVVRRAEPGILLPRGLRKYGARAGRAAARPAATRSHEPADTRSHEPAATRSHEPADPEKCGNSGHLSVAAGLVRLAGCLGGLGGLVLQQSNSRLNNGLLSERKKGAGRIVLHAKRRFRRAWIACTPLPSDHLFGFLRFSLPPGAGKAPRGLLRSRQIQPPRRLPCANLLRATQPGAMLACVMCFS